MITQYGDSAGCGYGNGNHQHNPGGHGDTTQSVVSDSQHRSALQILIKLWLEAHSRGQLAVRCDVHAVHDAVFLRGNGG